jgi:basic membrane protein A
MSGHISYVNSWSDRERAANLALIQVAGGVDIVFSVAGAASLGVIEAAADSNFYVIGTDIDQRSRAPDHVLVSTLKRVDVAVFDVIKSVATNDFKSGARMYGLKENGVGISLDNALPVVTDQMKRIIKELQSKIISGEILVPIK